MISALPDVKHITISPEDEFMIIACDGIWNFMTSQQVIDFVRIRINDGREKMSTICEEVRTTHWLTVCDGTLMFSVSRAHSCLPTVWPATRWATVPAATT